MLSDQPALVLHRPLPLSDGATAGLPTLLIVDDEENVLNALRRALRREGYRVLTASSGAAALLLLEQEAVDVVLSDQRMPAMTGVDFLRQARVLRPATVRMVLSGHSELASVTAAINEGAIYKYLTKPWDDDFLRASIREAFARKGLSDENQRLATALSIANDQLEYQNDLLQAALEEHLRRQVLSDQLLCLTREALDGLPLPVLGLNPDGAIAFLNQAGARLAPALGWQVGAAAPAGLPPACLALLAAGAAGTVAADLGGQAWTIDLRPLGSGGSRGHLLTLLPASAGTS